MCGKVRPVDDILGANEDPLIITIVADPDTWLPQIVLGVPVEMNDFWEEWPLSGVAPAMLTPEQAYQIGALLIQAATAVSSYYTELIDKPVEERREIIQLESQFLDSTFLPD